MSLRRWADAIRTQHWSFTDAWSQGQLLHLNNLLGEITGVAGSSLVCGNFIFNNQPNTDLGADGYDNYQAPKDQNVPLYLRRMWVGGDVTWTNRVTPNDVIKCTETVTGVRAVGSSAFVQIARAFESSGSTPFLRETRMLVYTNEKYLPSVETPSSKKATLAPGKTIVFSPDHVRRFCSLSYNLHKIHSDKNYCLTENLRDIVVPGPLLAATMLYYHSALSDLSLVGFRYRNSLPCYVNDEVEVGVKGRKVWISRESQSLCEGEFTHSNQ